MILSVLAAILRLGIRLILIVMIAVPYIDEAYKLLLMDSVVSEAVRRWSLSVEVKM